MAVLPAALTNCRRIDDGHHLTDVLLQQTVKEGLVAILQGGQEDISLEVTFFSLVVFVSASELFLNGRTMEWEQSQKPELTSLSFGKRAASVEQRVVQEEWPSQTRFD